MRTEHIEEYRKVLEKYKKRQGNVFSPEKDKTSKGSLKDGVKYNLSIELKDLLIDIQSEKIESLNERLLKSNRKGKEILPNNIQRFPNTFNKIPSSNNVYGPISSYKEYNKSVEGFEEQIECNFWKRIKNKVNGK